MFLLLCVFRARTARIVRQLEPVNLDEVVPRLDQLPADIPERLSLVQFRPELRAVVVADESDTVTGPAADDGIDGHWIAPPSSQPRW